MLYFAYGSNMCTGRLRQRVPSANPVHIAKLLNHSLRFHKRSDDRSGKCDAFFTGEPGDEVWGVVFEIDPAEKSQLDAQEGLGLGYAEKAALVIDAEGNRHSVFTYTAEASHSDPALFLVQAVCRRGCPPADSPTRLHREHRSDGGHRRSGQKPRCGETSRCLLKRRSHVSVR